jgi:2-polyprenyl-3-methyl-5-hydroxy-6-metoxy-1,4-benzoquinol methylase
MTTYADEPVTTSPAATVGPTEPSKTDRFVQKMLDAINGAGLALMTSVGHRTGLFDVMARLPAVTSAALAAEAKLSERYVREWLGAMLTAGVVDHDVEAGTYRLPPEHAEFLTRAASPNNLAVPMQWVAVLGCVEDEIVAAFRHGRGVPYSSYKRFHEVMAEESAQTTVAGLSEHILPLVPGLVRRLEQGIDVLDVGCGAGRAMIALARMFPFSRFSGYDCSADAIESARAEVRRLGLRNVAFRASDVATFKESGEYDLVTAFDAIHDQAKPDQVLRNVARSLRPGGTFLMQDIAASSHHHHNVGRPLGTFTYTISCMHCMSVSLANGGPGLGAAWGKELALRMLAEAGFENVRVEQLPHDIINYYYIATPRI